MYFQVKVPDNGRKYIFKEGQTRKRIPLIFSDVNVLTPKGKNNVMSTNKRFKILKKPPKTSIMVRKLNECF